MSVTEPEVIAHEVANPAHGDLLAYRAWVTVAQSEFGGVLSVAAELMNGTRVWQGTAIADAFAADLQGRADAVGLRFDELLADVDDRLAQVPATRIEYLQVW